MFGLPYAQRIKLCEDTERRLNYLLNKCKEFRIRITRPKDVNTYLKNVKAIQDDKRRASQLLFDAIDADV